MSDNGSGYVSRAFRAVCAHAGLRHLRTRAYTPRTNGKAERFIQPSSATGPTSARTARPLNVVQRCGPG